MARIRLARANSERQFDGGANGRAGCRPSHSGSAQSSGLLHRDGQRRATHRATAESAFRARRAAGVGRRAATTGGGESMSFTVAKPGQTAAMNVSEAQGSFVEKPFG